MKFDLFRFMKMRKETNELLQEKKKQKISEDDIDDNESIETVSDDEFDKYLGKIKLLNLLENKNFFFG
jgi:hypothetical protein